jgi:hypothetical protein
LSEGHKRTAGRVASSLAQVLTRRCGETAGRDITWSAIAGAAGTLKRAAEVDAALGVHLSEAITKSEAACAILPGQGLESNRRKYVSESTL